ncbi:MAG: hypothetical protein RIF36_12080 [Imperialibacter sp.]
MKRIEILAPAEPLYSLSIAIAPGLNPGLWRWKANDPVSQS